MALTSYMLGGLHSSSSPTHKHQRKRLRKAPPKAKSTADLYSCEEKLDKVRAQSNLVLFKSDLNSAITELLDSVYETPKARPEIGFLFENPQANASKSSMRNYSTVEMDPEILKRTRAKTPVFAIGQLETASMFIDKAQALAEQYQSLLPPRTFTPYPLNLPEMAPKKLQKTSKDQMSAGSPRLYQRRSEARPLSSVLRRRNTRWLRITFSTPLTNRRSLRGSKIPFSKSSRSKLIGSNGHLRGRHRPQDLRRSLDNRARNSNVPPAPSRTRR